MSASARLLSESVYCAERRVAAALAAGSYSVCGGRTGPSDGGTGVAVMMTGVGGPFAAAAAAVGTKREVCPDADDDDDGGAGDGAAHVRASSGSRAELDVVGGLAVVAATTTAFVTAL